MLFLHFLRDSLTVSSSPSIYVTIPFPHATLTLERGSKAASGCWDRWVTHQFDQPHQKCIIVTRLISPAYHEGPLPSKSCPLGPSHPSYFQFPSALCSQPPSTSVLPLTWATKFQTNMKEHMIMHLYIFIFTFIDYRRKGKEYLFY